MRSLAKAVLVRWVDRALVATGRGAAELPLARAGTFDWARTRARAVRRRRGVVGGVEVVVTAPGRAELRPVERVLAGSGEVTVEVLVSAVSIGTERAQWLRLPNARPELPFRPGYSGAGRVIAAGDERGELSPGTLVAVARLPHASIATVPAAWATPVPEGVPPEQAALVYLAVIAGYGLERARVRPGESVCVVGAGPIGALVHRLAMLREPGPVTVVASSSRGQAAAMRSGASGFRAGDSVDDIAAAVVIEATGDPEGVVTAVAAARPGATVVLLGSARGLSSSRALEEARTKGLRVVGAHVSALAVEARSLAEDPFQALARTYLRALAERKLDVVDLVGAPADPREIGLLYRSIAAGTVRAAHLDWRLLPESQRLRPRRVLAAPALPPSRPNVRPVLPPTSRRATRQLRFAVIGCGDIGLINARAVAAAPGAQLVLCHDAVPAIAEATGRDVRCAVASTLEQALDPDHVDAVFLSVPHDLHQPLVEQAASAGLHVVVEKPLASDLVAARAAVAAAERAGVALSVCFPYRYEPALVAARRLVRAGALGELRGCSVLFHANKPDSYWSGGFSGRSQSDWRASLARSGGGVLIMNVTHYIDFIRHVAGLEPARVSATARTREGAEVEETIALTIDFHGGAVGSLLASSATSGEPAGRFELWGDSGTVRLEPDPAIYSERAIDGLVPGRWCALPQEPAGNPRAQFVEQFCAAVLEGRPPDVTAADGLAVQAFVAAAYQAARERGGPVDVMIDAQ
jgi:predicted dehydrogenase